MSLAQKFLRVPCPALLKPDMEEASTVYYILATRLHAVPKDADIGPARFRAVPV